MQKKSTAVLREPAEVRFAAELSALAAEDSGPRPPGWKLSARAVRTFIIGAADDRPAKKKKGDKPGKNEAPAITRKFFGDDALVDRAIVTLMSNRGLLLVGEPGTAKSMLSELLTAAISGSSALTIQGTAGTTEDQIKYSWNYALLLAEGPTLNALVPAPLYHGLRNGQIVRFEEITRCPPEIQDTLISVLSDKVLHIPELKDEAGILMARPGFNVIATANTRDRGVHEMSAALKRRFNFETVAPIADKAQELEIVLADARASCRRWRDAQTTRGSAGSARDDLHGPAPWQDGGRHARGKAAGGHEHGRGGIGRLRRRPGSLPLRRRRPARRTSRPPDRRHRSQGLRRRRQESPPLLRRGGKEPGPA